jgi:hypothetical protein
MTSARVGLQHGLCHFCQASLSALAAAKGPNIISFAAVETLIWIYHSLCRSTSLFTCTHKSRSLDHHHACQRRDVPAPEPTFAPQSPLAVPEAPLQVTGRPVPGSAEIATPLDLAQSGRFALSTDQQFISNTGNMRATLATYCNRFDSSIVDGMPWRRLTVSRSQGQARLCCAVRQLATLH